MVKLDEDREGVQTAENVQRVMDKRLTPKAKADPEKTYEYYVKARNGKKRDYLFSVSKMKTCPHLHLHALSVGGITYRCEDCNWTSTFPGAYQQPLHLVVVGGLLNALHFAKEFGGDSLEEVLRKPMGQHEADFHMPVLPEGMSFWDAVAAMDLIDVTQEELGRYQLKELLERHWIPESEIKRRASELQGAGIMKALGERNGSEPKSVGDGRSQEATASLRGAGMPSLPPGAEPHPQSGDSREP